MSECGLTPQEVSTLTIHEVRQLQRGQELQNEKQERASQRGSVPSADQRRREQEALEKYA